MYFIPVQSEKISNPGGQSAQATSGGLDNSGLFGSLLASQLVGTDKTSNLKNQLQSFGDTRQTKEQVAINNLAQALEIGQLQGSGKKQLMDLVKKIIQLLQKDSEGKQLLKSLENGELSLLLPLKLQEGQGTPGKLAFLVVQKTGKYQDKFTELSTSSGMNSSGGDSELMENTLLESLGMNLIWSQLSGTDGQAVISENMMQDFASAGTLKLTGDRVEFHAEQSGTGNLPVILFRSAEQQNTMGIDKAVLSAKSTGNTGRAEVNSAKFNAEQSSPRIPLNSVLMLSNNNDIEEISGLSGKSSMHQSVIHSVHALEKGLAGEIGALLKSLGGNIQIRKARGAGQSVEKAAQSMHRFSAERQHQHIAQKVVQSDPGQSKHYSSDSSRHQSGTEQKLSASEQLVQNLTGQNNSGEFSADLKAFTAGDIFSLGTAGNKTVNSPEIVGRTRPILLQVIQKIDSMVQAVKTHQSMTRPQILNARLALEPKHLGSLVMQLRYQGDTISGTIVAASREAKNIIEHSLPMLKDALLSHHTHLQNVKVEIQQNFTSDQSADSYGQQFAGQSNQDTDSDGSFDEFDLDEILRETGSITSSSEPQVVQNSRDGWYA